MHSLYFPFTLRLYAHTLRCLGDPNWTGLDLFYHIKDCWKERDEPVNILTKPLERGLPLKIGEWCYKSMLDFESMGASTSKSYWESLDNEGFFWFVDDIVEAVQSSELFGEADVIGRMAVQISDVDALYESNEAEYWNQIDGVGRKELAKAFEVMCREYVGPISEMGLAYSYEIGDRIVHDRQLCGFIAERVMEIGFDGEVEEGVRAQWVKRERWPEWVKAILRARDRGMCARCDADLVSELRGSQHIDHIFPISQGGCNDIVNLQLLCEKCNCEKGNDEARLATSIPNYIRRPRRSV